MIISEKPWECPRCRSWHGPQSLKCDCQPIVRNYCTECMIDALRLFNPPYPSLEVLAAYAEDFHENTEHRKNDNY